MIRAIGMPFIIIGFFLGVIAYALFEGMKAGGNAIDDLLNKAQEKRHVRQRTKSQY